MEKITRNDIKESVATGTANLLTDFANSLIALKKVYDGVMTPIANKMAGKIIVNCNMDELGKTVTVTR